MKKKSIDQYDLDIIDDLNIDEDYNEYPKENYINNQENIDEVPYFDKNEFFNPVFTQTPKRNSKKIFSDSLKNLKENKDYVDFDNFYQEWEISSIKQSKANFDDSDEKKINGVNDTNIINNLHKKFEQNELRLSYIQKSNLDQELCSKEGELFKKSSKIFKSWSKKRCLLKDKKFICFKENSNETSLILDFDLINVNIECNFELLPIEFKLIPKDSKKEFCFRFLKNDKDQKDWIKKIEIHIYFSLGKRQNLTSICRLPKFWKVKYLVKAIIILKNEIISNESLLMKADTFDIILFKGKSILAKLQRSLTQSEYDHVALVLRYDDSNIIILEATEQYVFSKNSKIIKEILIKGVCLAYWKSLIENKSYENYEKIVYRHLEFSRSDFNVSKMEQFVKMVVGKKYKISAEKLLKRYSVIPNGQKKENFEEKTFFCSELVAAAYKFIGLLEQEKSCSQYWPGSFSSKNKIDLKMGASLSNDYLIDFSTKI